MTSTQEANYYAWRICQRAYVKYGAHGKQLAECVGFDRSGRVLAQKFSARSRKWTKTRIVVREDEFICFAAEQK